MIGAARDLFAIDADDDRLEAGKRIRLPQQRIETDAVAGALRAGKRGERQGSDKGECGSSFHVTELGSHTAMKRGNAANHSNVTLFLSTPQFDGLAKSV
ncbi:hypothetical protein L907_19335 [Agrobacterium sp. C13]|nr:hypothetical protein L903_20245 [Agrobacterium sp. JL28]KVK49444.1 hypothetical protein L904_20235 [Agrobacterium sp. LY4]KVK62527.1 hypothetical protein L906_19360 [Agrobacterium sp. TS45]KVK67061.1 hypothetical protein L907_19335 [Agrobacterium sp. C13]